MRALAAVTRMKNSSETLYEGRPINKLQNGAIPSLLNVGKIQIIRFVGNLTQ